MTIAIAVDRVKNTAPARQRASGADIVAVADRAATFALTALEKTELRIVWPPPEIERLSPGLELVEAA